MDKNETPTLNFGQVVQGEWGGTTRKAKKVKEQMSTAATATTTPQSDSNNGVAIAITHMDTQNICKSKQRVE